MKNFICLELFKKYVNYYYNVFLMFIEEDVVE